jgi:hypothetical protein
MAKGRNIGEALKPGRQPDAGLSAFAVLVNQLPVPGRMSQHLQPPGPSNEEKDQSDQKRDAHDDRHIQVAKHKKLNTLVT